MIFNILFQKLVRVLSNDSSLESLRQFADHEDLEDPEYTETNDITELASTQKSIEFNKPASLKGYKAILEKILSTSFPSLPLSTLETYQNADPICADKIQARMIALTPDGFSSSEAWRLAWQTFRQKRCTAKQLNL